MPDVPELADINRFSIKRDEKILEEIIKPKDDIIKELYNDNLALHRELSKQSRVIKEAEKYQKERDEIIADNKELNNRVKELENEYKGKSITLDLKFDNRKRKLEKEFQEKTYDMEYEYKSKVRKLEKENSKLHRIIDKFYESIDKFIHWICEKFDMGAEDNLIRDFQKETNTFLDPEKQIKKEEREMDIVEKNIVQFPTENSAKIYYEKLSNLKKEEFDNVVTNLKNKIIKCKDDKIFHNAIMILSSDAQVAGLANCIIEYKEKIMMK